MFVLIVEDDPLLSFALQTVVNAAGHNVLGPVATSTAALRIAETQAVDLALVDINLLDGRTGTQLARALHDRIGIPVVFLSGDLDEARAARSAAIGILPKPYRPEDVPECILFAVSTMSHGSRAGVPARFEVFSI